MMEPIFDLILFSLLFWACYHLVRVVQCAVRDICGIIGRILPREASGDRK